MRKCECFIERRYSVINIKFVTETKIARQKAIQDEQKAVLTYRTENNTKFMWNSILKTEEDIIQINHLLEKIYEYIHNSKLIFPLGAMGGYAGTLLFLLYMHKYSNKEKYLIELQDRIRFLCSNLGYVKIDSFCNGYAGICWLLRYLHAEGTFECEDIDKLLSDVDKHIYEGLNLSINNNDFLHGALGMAYYFTYYNTPYSKDAISAYINALDRSKILENDGCIKWISDAYAKNQKIASVYNLGMAHGMASLIYYLSLCLEKNIEREKTYFMLNGLIKYYMNNTNPNNFSSVYSFWLMPSKKEYTETRLAWCYGDPGVASSLFRAGSIIKDKSIIDFSLNIFDRTLKRFDKKENYVAEAAICHGSAGLSIIYNSIFQKTRIERYKNAALFWTRDIVKKSEEKGMYAGYVLHDAILENEEENSTILSLINGLSGIGLSMLSSISDDYPSWKKFFMI